MKFRFPIPILVATLAFSGAVAFQTEAQAQNRPRPNNSSRNQTTVFRCVRSNGGFATVAERGSNRSYPMIVWQSNIFGPEYTPEVRCQTVSQRLTNAVAQNGGSLRNLLLTTGRIGNYTVVCYVNTGASTCNRSNMLFTLRPESARDPGAALASLLRFGSGAGGSTLYQSAGEENTTIDMAEAVEQAFAGGGYQSGGEDEDSPVSSDPSESVGGNDYSPVEPPSNTPDSQIDGSQGEW